MAYTISTVNNAATLVGTNGVDEANGSLDLGGLQSGVASTVTSLEVSSFDDADTFVQTFAGTVSGSRIGMGANADTVVVTAAGFAATNITAGDGRDNVTVSLDNGTALTVRGGGGLDNININPTAAGTNNQLVNSFINGNAGRDIINVNAIVDSIAGNAFTDLFNTSIVGGSEGDAISVAANQIVNGRVNGQVGDDIIVIDHAVATNFTVFGGSENDRITNGSSVDGGPAALVMSGDKGNDTLIGGGSDDLLGGEGNDLLDMAGADNATGGSGVDTFDITDVAAANTAAITYAESASGADGLVSNGDTISFGPGGSIATITDATSSDLFDAGFGAFAEPANILGEDLVDVAGFVTIVGEYTETEFGTLFTVDANGGDQLIQLDAGDYELGAVAGDAFVVLLDASAPVASQWVD